MGFFSSVFGVGFKGALTESKGVLGAVGRYFNPTKVLPGLTKGGKAWGDVGSVLKSDWPTLERTSTGIAQKMATQANTSSNAARLHSQQLRRVSHAATYEIEEALTGAGGNMFAGATPKQQAINRAAYARKVHKELLNNAGATMRETTLSDMSMKVLSENTSILSESAKAHLTDETTKHVAVGLVNSRLARNVSWMTNKNIPTGIRSRAGSGELGKMMTSSWQNYRTASTNMAHAEQYLMQNAIGRGLLYTLPALGIPIAMTRMARGKKGGLPLVPLI